MAEADNFPLDNIVGEFCLIVYMFVHLNACMLNHDDIC
jgi:hypothetical protein